MGNKILLIEDTIELAALITLYLNKAGMDIRPVESGEEALVALEGFQPELVLLDLNLPGMGGFEFLQIFRRTSQVPVLIISARDSEEDIIEGLGDGADEYITKPFSPKVLVARVQAMLRRTGNSSDSPVPKQAARFGPFTIIFDRYLLTKEDQRVPLSSREFAILAHLVRNAGIPLSTNAIYRDVWGRTYGDVSAVAVYIQRLRRKIEEDSSNPQFIQNIHGLGYQFDANVQWTDDGGAAPEEDGESGVSDED